MPNTVMIKIKSCPNPKYWYAKYIGQTFVAEKKLGRYAGEEAYIVDIEHLPMRGKTGYVNVQYAKLVEKKSKPIKGE